jgi:hypothetical protein
MPVTAFDYLMARITDRQKGALESVKQGDYGAAAADFLGTVLIDKAIVELHSPTDGYTDDIVCYTCGPFEDIRWRITEYGEGWPCKTFRLILSKYADHPDYQEEWNQ